MKIFYTFFLIFISMFIFINCSDSDDSDVKIDVNKEYKISKRVYYENNIESEENFQYDLITGYVKEIKGKNTTRKFEYLPNSVVIDSYNSNNVLVSRNIYKYNNSILTQESYNRDSKLTSKTLQRIKNNKVILLESFDSNDNLTNKISYEYENNGLKEISFNEFTNETEITIYTGKTIKNYISAFAYLVHNDQPIKLEILRNNVKMKYEYKYNKDGYPLEINLLNEDNSIKSKTVQEYY